MLLKSTLINMRRKKEKNKLRNNVIRIDDYLGITDCEFLYVLDDPPEIIVETVIIEGFADNYGEHD